jgi:hypothetical protein
MHDSTPGEQKVILFSAWIDGTLNNEQQAQFEQLCLHDPEFSKQVEHANYIGLLSDTSQELTPPVWNKNEHFEFTNKVPWWQWQAMPVAAFACSIVALLMVATGFNINIENGRASFGFGSDVPTQQIEALVQARMDDYLRSNQALLTQYVDSMQKQQLQTSTQLTEYLLTSNRQERREDFAELLKFVNQQRYDDQIFYARQLNDLQDEINIQTGFRVDTVIPVSDISIND